MKLLLRVVLMLLMTGCTTTARYEADLQEWVGQSLDTLVLAWGPPQSSYTLKDGRKVIEYLRQQIVHHPGHMFLMPRTVYQEGLTYDNDGKPTGIFRSDGVVFLPEEEPASDSFWQCRTRFIVDTQDIIRQWHWEGNNCRK